MSELRLIASSGVLLVAALMVVQWVMFGWVAAVLTGVAVASCLLACVADAALAVAQRARGEQARSTRDELPPL